MDGPVATASALLARDLGSQSRLWCTLPDHGQHPTAVRASEVLNLTPLLDLRMELGEGAAALAALPLLNHALTLASTISPPAPAADEPDEPSTTTDEPASEESTATVSGPTESRTAA
jgi:NaMN:DMB phosphoribosyltransferase